MSKTHPSSRRWKPVHVQREAIQGVRPSDRLFRLAFDAAQTGMLLFDREGVWLDANPALCQALGRSRDDLVGRAHPELIPPGCADLQATVLEELERAGNWRGEFPLLHADGRTVAFDWRVSLLPESNIRLALATDISEEHYRAIVEGQGEMVCRFRPDGALLFTNGAYARARGTTPQALIGVNFWDFIEEEDRSTVRAMLDRLRPDSPEVCIENRFETAKGVRWTMWTNRGLVFDAEGRATEVQSSGIDITDRKLTEEALREREERLQELNESLERHVVERTAELEQQNARLRWLTSELTQAEQRERGKLGKTLHDGLQQILVATRMQIAAHSDEARTLDQVLQLIDEAIAATRSLAYELSPPRLREAPLPKSIEWLANWFAENHKHTVEVATAHDFPSLNDDAKVLLYTIVRELLLNSVKHSGVRQAEVRLLRGAEGQARLEVEDQGKGFEPSFLQADSDLPQSFGLFSIRERVCAVGGQMHVDTSIGGGACFIVEVPITGTIPACRS